MIYFALYINMSELSQKISEKLVLIYEGNRQKYKNRGRFED
jgi:hypothetical protein